MAGHDEAPELSVVLPGLSNDEFLLCLDLVLFEAERRLLCYAQDGAEVNAMADEGLILAVRAAARLHQSKSAALQAASHLQTLGDG